MALKGDLASVDLAQVFQMLALNQKVGLLGIQSPRTWRALYFDSRGVTLYYNEHTLVDRVLAVLVQSGRLPEQSLQEARDHAATTGNSVTDVLLAGGYLTDDEMLRMLRSELEEDIYDLFFWNDARFEFFEGASSFEGREGVINEEFFFSTDSLIMEAARRIDEWSYIGERVPGPLEVYTSTGHVDVNRLDDSAMSVLDFIDGKRNVARLVEVTGIPAFHAYKAVAQLLDGGSIAPLTGGQLEQAATDCAAEGRLQDAINLYEKAVQDGVGVPGVHLQLADVYEAYREYELCVYHLRCYAEALVEGKSLRQAVAILRRVVDLVPTDLESRERLVELTIAHSELKSDDFNPMSEGKALVDLYLEIGETGRVRSVLERLLRECPGDLELKKILINVHTKTGDTERVIELLESVANDLVEAREPIQAINYLHKILRLDSSRSDINDRIRQLYRMDERRRSRRRSLMGLGVLFVVLSGLGTVYYFYNEYAQEKYEAIDVSGMIDAADYGGARRAYEDFKSGYPFTQAATVANSQLARIDSLQAEHDERMRTKERTRQRELGRIRKKYEEAWTKGQAFVRQGNTEDALREIEKVVELLQEAGDPEDLRWADENKVAKNLADMRRFLGEAAALERAARGALDNGDWQSARDHLTQLVKNYPVTRIAAGVRLPVEVQSRPPGATILIGGKPLLRDEDGQQVPVVTPAVMQLPHDQETRMVLQLAGFQPEAVLVNPRESATADFVLTVVPGHRFTFGDAARSGLMVSNGLGIVGLNGGRLGLADLKLGRVLGETALGDLTEMQGLPVVHGSYGWFLTNDQRIDCRDLRSGRTPIGWPVPLRHEVLHQPVLASSRLLLTDEKGFARALDMRTGEQLWEARLGGLCAGPPLVVGSQAWFATTRGRVVGLSLASGRQQRVWTTGCLISTGLHRLKQNIVFGTSDGRVVSLRTSDGGTAWTHELGRSQGVGRLVVGDDFVIAHGDDNHLRRLDSETGEQLLAAELRGDLREVLAAFEGRLFYVVRVRGKDVPTHDVMQVRSLSDFALQWEFQDGGQFTGPITVSGGAVWLPNSTGEVVQFR